MMEELLHILEKNARLPVEDIAAMMDLETTILVLKDYLSYSYSLLGES